MEDISYIDRNFKVETRIDKPDMMFYDALSYPFKIYGVFYENGKFRRMPEAVARGVSDGVYALHANTAGGRLRFKTDSPYVAIHTRMSKIGKMPHFALCGSAGFDLYADNDYAASFVPPFHLTNGYEKLVEFPATQMRDITIHFPLYSEVEELYIGVKRDAVLQESSPYTVEKPIVYYGSSITQGGCASRPGNAYPGFISRTIDADYINLGFSGSAKGEKAMADYIKSLSMSAFVYDYDHNAPTSEHLARTHEKMFWEIRKENESLPIVIMSRPKYRYDEAEKMRFEIIQRTYENAVARGESNVYLIDGRTLMSACKNEGTVDGCHPTDLGFFSMASELTKLLQTILGKAE